LRRSAGGAVRLDFRALHGDADPDVQLDLAAGGGLPVNAAAAGFVLVFMTLAMNGLAIYVRYRLRKNIKW
jgi:hypothetical protein